MPSQSRIWGSSIISSTKNCLDLSLGEEIEAIVQENEEIHHPPSNEVGGRSPDYDIASPDNEKTLVPEEPLAKVFKKSRKSYKCSICHKISRNRTHLNDHINSVHKKIKRFSCDLCPVQFYSKNSLKNHLQRHFKNPNFQHKILNTSNELRPFQCEVENCGKYFTTRGKLTVHQRVHSGS